MEKLKVGDWITFTDISDKNPKQIIKIENGIAYTKSNKCLIEQAVKWIPEPDEWCWFWDYLGFTPTIGIYVGIEEENFLADIPNGKGSLSLTSFKYCQPLIGEIPFHLKDL